MLSFPLELLERAWPGFLSAIGTTGLGFFINTIAEFFVTLGVTHLVILVIRGRAAMKDDAAQNLAVAVIVFVVAFPILYGPIYYHRISIEKNRIIEEAGKIKMPHPRPPSLPLHWDIKFIKPFCYVMFDTIRPQFKPQFINGRWAFHPFVLSSVNRHWDGVAVRIRRQDRTGFLLTQEIGTLRVEGFILDQIFSPELSVPYLVIILTASQQNYFQEILTFTESNGNLEQQIQIYRGQQHGPPILLFDSVAQGALP
jgi:hypothetical protein